MVEYDLPKCLDFSQASQEELDEIERRFWEIVNSQNSQPRSVSAPVELMETPTSTAVKIEEEEESEAEYSTTDPELVIMSTNPNDPSLLYTDLLNLRTVVATKCQHEKGQLSKTTCNFPGFICLPLSAIGMLRYPDKRHVFNPHVLVYVPTNPGDINRTGITNPDLIEKSCKNI